MLPHPETLRRLEAPQSSTVFMVALQTDEATLTTTEETKKTALPPAKLQNLCLGQAHALLHVPVPQIPV